MPARDTSRQHQEEALLLAVRVAGAGPVRIRQNLLTRRLDLKPVGSAGAASGKGRALTVFGARNCATGTVPATLTKKTVKKAKAVTFKVNGKKVATFRGKKLKKRTAALAANPTTSAEVKATITLKNGKKVTATRTYLACS